MVKQRHKTHFFSYVFTLITLVFIVLVLTPYMPLEEGSFFGAVLPEIYSILVRYAGVFRSGIFSTLTPYTLVPAMLCLILFTADSIFSIEFHRRFFHLLFFAGVFFFCEAAQSTQYAFISAGRVYFFYGGAALAAVSFLLSLIFQIREIVSVYGGRKEPVEEILMPETEVREPYISEEERRIMNMTDEEALKILESLTVPEFDKYDNYIPERALFSGRDGNANFYSMAHEISDLQREGKAKRDSYEELKRNREQARRDRLSKIFQPRFIKEDEEEDDIFSDSIKADSEPQVDIRIDNQTPQFAPQQQAQVIYVQTPQPQVIYVQTENGGTKISMPSAPVQPVVPVQPQIEPQSVPQVDVSLLKLRKSQRLKRRRSPSRIRLRVFTRVSLSRLKTLKLRPLRRS